MAALLLRPNRVIAGDRLAQWLWSDEEGVANPRATLHTYIRRLRTGLRNPRLIETSAAGYCIRVDASSLDLIRFRELVAQAGETEGLEQRSELLTLALGLVRGPMLEDIPSEFLRRDFGTALTEELLQVREQYFDVEMRLGRHVTLIRDLREVAIDNPLRERVWGQLMLALYLAGRQAEALDVYQQVRGFLIEQLGTEPTGHLRALHQRILNSDPGLTDFGSRTDEPAVSPGVPRQLPPPVVGFVGRGTEIAVAETVLRNTGETGVVPIVILCGSPGVGKSALAIHIAQRVRDGYPDGQLYVNLRGHGMRSPATAASVISQFLRALGTPANAIPLDAGEQLNLFRTQLADKRVLLVLDNAVSAAQIEMLLPGTPSCAVLVTARRRLSGLAISYGAHAIDVDTLEPAESRSLVLETTAAAGVSITAELADELAALCAHLPLALRIALANLTAAPNADPELFVGDLREGNTLAAFTVDDDTRSAVCAAFSLSYETLAPDEQRAFRLLGLVPGPDFTAGALAALGDITTAEARRLLDRLAGANLIQQHAPGRYTFHDLLRRFAQDRIAAESEQDLVEPALHRLGSWYWAMVDASARVLHRDFVRLPAPALVFAPDTAPANEDQAMAWLIAEHPNLVATIVFFARTEPHRFSWLLADGMRGYFWTGNHRTDWLESTTAALYSAITAGDSSATAAMYRSLANLYTTMGQFQRALEFYAQALEIHRGQGRTEEVAAILNNMGLAYLSAGRLDELETTCREALELEVGLDNRRAEATTLALLGSVHASRGRTTTAIEVFDRSLLLARELGIQHIEGYSLRGITLAFYELGDLGTAQRYCDQAMAVAQRIGSSYDRSITLYGLALISTERGDEAAARRYAQEAIQTFADCGDRTYEIDTICLLAFLDVGQRAWSDAAARADHALSAARDIGYANGIAMSAALLAVAEHSRGNAPRALDCVDIACSTVATLIDRTAESKVWLILGYFHLLARNPVVSVECAERALAICRENGQRLRIADGERLLASAREREFEAAVHFLGSQGDVN